MADDRFLFDFDLGTILKPKPQKSFAENELQTHLLNFLKNESIFLTALSSYCPILLALVEGTILSSGTSVFGKSFILLLVNLTECDEVREVLDERLKSKGDKCCSEFDTDLIIQQIE